MPMATAAPDSSLVAMVPIVARLLSPKSIIDE
jgi:hypothetical protein